MEKENKIAILIDGDNAECGLMEQYISEVGRFGRVTVKRVYADWMDIRMKNWKEPLNKFAIKPMQKFAYTTGKNSTDTALIIDAMDLLHSKTIDGICIVSSDSDYTGLAHRVREEGLFIMGIGRSHTPHAFINACESFVFSESLQIMRDLREKQELAKNRMKEYEEMKIYETPVIQMSQLILPKAVEKVEAKANMNVINSPRKAGMKLIDQQVETAFQMVVDIHTQEALLSKFSTTLRKIHLGFDHKNFGASSFKKFCEELPHYQIIVHSGGQMFLKKKKGYF